MTATFSTRVPLYGTRLRLKIAEQPEFDKEGLSDCAACVLTTDEPFALTVLLRPRAAPGTVAHEALHVTRRALERAGVRFNASTEETYAYTLDWVVEWLTAKLNSHANSKTA